MYSLFKPILDIVLIFQKIKTILSLSSRAQLIFTYWHFLTIFSSLSLTWSLGRYSLWHLLIILCIFERRLYSVLVTWVVIFLARWQIRKTLHKRNIFLIDWIRDYSIQVSWSLFSCEKKQGWDTKIHTHSDSQKLVSVCLCDRYKLFLSIVLVIKRTLAL